MSPRRCTIVGCSSLSGHEEHRNITFHTIPLNMSIRKIWLENCKIPKTRNITKSILVCSRHFLPTDFQPTKNDKNHLKQGIVPTIFPWGTMQAVDTSLVSSSDANSNSSKSCDSPAPSDETAPTTKVLSSIKAEKLSALKQRSVSADEHLGTAHTSSDKSMPRKSLDSSTWGINKYKSAANITSLTTEDLSKKKQDFVSKFKSGMSLEAQDFNEIWHNAQIMEVDHGEKEVFIHFIKDTKTRGPV